jgi:integrase
VHLRHLQKALPGKSEAPLGRVGPRDLEGFLQARLKLRSPTTVAKDRATVAGFFAWAARRGYLPSSPADGLPRVKAGGDRPPFRTAAEIDAIVARGGLTRAGEWALWDGLYLTPAEAAGVLALVRGRARRDVSFVLHALPAYTGMRRGEVLRLRWAATWSRSTRW